MKHEKMSNIQNNLQISKPISVMWKNCNLFSELKKQSQESKQQSSSSFKNEAADLIDIVFNVQKKHEDITGDMNYLNKDQSEMLASLVPNLLINAKSKLSGYSTTFAGIILFIDISGFTAMCEKYSQHGAEGTDRMTVTLNRYLGPMVYEIYSHGGDVVKFAGDALLAVWKASIYEYAWSLVHSAIVCSKYIQHAFGSYQTDIGIILKVKAAIAAGNLTFSVIGPPNYNHYILAGPPVEELKKTERMCSAGDVLVAPSAWGLCPKRNYYYEEKEGCALILRIIYNPNDIKLKFFEFPRRDMAEPSINRSISSSSLSDTSEMELITHKQDPVRPCLQALYRNEDIKYLQGFVIKQVVHQIKAEQPLYFLTEMRSITTMFVNLIPKQKDVVEKLIQDVNNAYFTISQFVTQSLGSVNLVGMFDKDVMFLVTFGLRGEDHEGETARSLKCAYDIRQALRDKEYVESISVGVTCGMTYCGIVGHTVRKCYTVLGSTVNKAARLMCYYENKVTCDEQTFKNANLPLNQFIVQETKQLKGIKDAGIVYEYISVAERHSAVSNMSNISYRNDHYVRIFGENLNFKHLKCVIITGPQGVGKTNLLKYYQRQASGSTVIFITLTLHHAMLPYYLIQKIFKKIFGDGKWKNREDTFQQLIGPKKKHLLCSLNPVFQTNFKGDMRAYNKNKVMEVFRAFAGDVCENYIILIDDAHYTDSNSMPFIKEIVDTHKTFVVMTFTKTEYQSPELVSFIDSLQGKVVELKNLDKDLILPVSCRLFDVVALPKDITSVLLSRSRGNPGWCNQYLNYLLENGKLAIVRRSLADVKKDREMVLSDIDEHSAIRMFLKNERAQVKVAITVNETTLLPASMCGMIMSTFDRLGPYEQVLLKCAAAMGKEFSFAQLIKVLPEQPVENIDRAIKHLLQLNFLQCKTTAVWNEVNHERRMSCFCNDKEKTSNLCLEYFEDSNDFKYCQKLSFKVKVMQDIIYDLMTINQNKIFHSKAFKYLSELKIRCRVCKNLEQMEDDGSSFLDITDIKNTMISNTKKGLNTYKLMLVNPSDHKYDDTIIKLCTINKFENCTCLIMKKNYFEILNKHGKRLDKHKKLVSLLLEEAEVLIDLEEKTEAFDIANKAFKHIEEYHSSSKQNLISGRIYIVAGRGYFLDNNTKVAKEYLKKGLGKLNKTLNFQSWGPFKHFITQERQDFIAEISELKLSAYNCLCDVYFVEGNINKVYSYALKAYHTAKIIPCKFKTLCLIYTNLIISHNLEYSQKVKNSVNQFVEILCPKNLHTLKSNEVIHIGMVYTAIFKRMLIEGRSLDEVLKSGAIALEIARKCNASEVKCFILPLMVSSLLYRGFMDDAIDALKEYSNEELQYPTHYYNLCLDFLLYGGISLSDVQNIINHARDLVDSDEEMTALNKLLFSKVLLWYLRNKQLEEATFWFNKLGPIIKEPLEDYEFSIRYIHCHILALVHGYNQNDTLNSNIENEIRKLLTFVNVLENNLTISDGFTQLLILFNKSYLYKLLGDNKRCEDYLAKIKKKCDQTDNILVNTWIDHCKTVWNEPNHSSVDNWVMNSESGHFDIKQWSILSWPNFMYSLPLIKSDIPS